MSRTVGGFDISNVTTSDPQKLLLLLANEVVTRAVCEWKDLKAGKISPSYDCNIPELERFFKSEYCDALIYNTGMTGEYILKKLKEWEREELKGHAENTD